MKTTAKVGKLMVTQQDNGTKFADLRSQAEDKGLKKLGNGVFGVTYQHPTDQRLVIKIGRESARHSRNGLRIGSWTLWTMMSQEALDNTFRPIMLSLDTFSHKDDYCYVAVMEKLFPANINGEYDRLPSMILKKATSLAKFRHLVHEGDTKSATCKAAVDLCNVLGMAFRTGNDDLHNGNIMMRVRNGIQIPVITDPIT